MLTGILHLLWTSRKCEWRTFGNTNVRSTDREYECEYSVNVKTGEPQCPWTNWWMVFFSIFTTNEKELAMRRWLPRKLQYTTCTLIQCMNRYSYLHRTHLFHIYHEKALIYTSFSVRSWTTSTVREQLQTSEARRSISNWICRLKNEEMPPPAMHTLKIYIKMSKNALAQSPLMGTLDLKCWNKKYGKPSQQIKLTKQTWANTGWSYYSPSRLTAKTKMIINSFKIPYLRLCYLHSLQNQI